MKSLRILLLVFALTACSPNSNLTPAAIPSGTSTPAFVAKISETPTFPVTDTPTTIPTKEISWPISEVPACNSIKAQDQFSSDDVFTGSVLSQEQPPYFPKSGFGRFGVSGLYRFDFATKTDSSFIKPDDYQEKKVKITRVGVEDLSVSPDFQKAVYLVDVYTNEYALTDASVEPEKQWLEIYDSASGERKRLPWKDEWAYIIGWVNNNLFAVRSGGATLLLDSSGNIKQQFLASKYPDYSNPRAYNPDVYVLWGAYKALGPYSFDDTVTSWFNRFYRDTVRMNNPPLEVYSPTLKYVVYTEVKDRKPGVVLYDIESRQKIIEISTGPKLGFAAFGGAPVWSSDGRQVLMLLPTQGQHAGQQNLYLLDVSGKIEQITSFEILGPYSWSPDGKSIAFWIPTGLQIGVLNLENKDLQVYCVKGDYFNDGSYFTGSLPAAGELFWLPGGQQILVEIAKTVGDGNYEGIGLVDLEKGLFTEIKWNVEYPIWLKK
ncbi:MAG: hypothetical protein WA821_19325 [Anaerolineales bacterium]